MSGLLLMIAATVLILAIAFCLFQSLTSVGTGDRRAALTWATDAGLFAAFGLLLTWGGAWS
jgi:predicted Co/Zn/Cd cation transporter (cation efflux family)